VGREALGARDGRLALFARDQFPLLHIPATVEIPAEALHHRIREHLASRGASFFREIYAAAEGGDPGTVVDALWDLVWAGEVTNDTLAPLRAFLWGKAKRSSGGRRPALPTATPAAGSGRWYLVNDLLTAGPAPTPESIAKAQADQLLERHGIVVREAVLAEGFPGGFAALYPVLAAMEDAGRVRRGYFVEGRGGAQFGAPGAIDRLRATEGSAHVALSAVDPANVYGAAVPWPQHENGRPARRAGAHALLSEGRLVGYVERGGRSVLTFGAADPDEVANLLAGLAARHRARMTIETVDGSAATGSPLAGALQTAGFVVGYKGLTYRPRAGGSVARR
jgi:ATP-dependent Lhr-like helicase